KNDNSEQARNQERDPRIRHDREGGDEIGLRATQEIECRQKNRGDNHRSDDRPQNRGDIADYAGKLGLLVQHLLLLIRRYLLHSALGARVRGDFAFHERAPADALAEQCGHTNRQQGEQEQWNDPRRTSNDRFESCFRTEQRTDYTADGTDGFGSVRGGQRSASHFVDSSKSDDSRARFLCDYGAWSRKLHSEPKFCNVDTLRAGTQQF